MTVGDRVIECDVIDYRTQDSNADRSVRMAIWKSDEVTLPPRELRVSHQDHVSIPSHVLQVTREEHRGHSTSLSSLKVVDLAAELEVAGKKLSSSIEEVSLTLENELSFSRMAVRRWICDSVPGRIAREDLECTGSKEVTPGKYTSRHDVVAFEVVR